MKRPRRHERSSSRRRSALHHLVLKSRFEIRRLQQRSSRRRGCVSSGDVRDLAPSGLLLCGRLVAEPRNEARASPHIESSDDNINILTASIHMSCFAKRPYPAYATTLPFMCRIAFKEDSLERSVRVLTPYLDRPAASLMRSLARKILWMLLFRQEAQSPTKTQALNRMVLPERSLLSSSPHVCVDYTKTQPHLVHSHRCCASPVKDA